MGGQWGASGEPLRATDTIIHHHPPTATYQTPNATRQPPYTANHPDHKTDVDNTYLECVVLQSCVPSYEVRELLRDKAYAATLIYLQVLAGARFLFNFKKYYLIPINLDKAYAATLIYLLVPYS